jgi:hypothetical protein
MIPDQATNIPIVSSCCRNATNACSRSRCTRRGARPASPRPATRQPAARRSAGIRSATPPAFGPGLRQQLLGVAMDQLSSPSWSSRRAAGLPPPDVAGAVEEGGAVRRIIVRRCRVCVGGLRQEESAKSGWYS